MIKHKTNLLSFLLPIYIEHSTDVFYISQKIECIQNNNQLE